MPQVKVAGEIRVRGNRVSWALWDFSSYPHQCNNCIRSPFFSCLDRRWRIAFLPNGLSSKQTEGWLGVILYNETDRTQFRVRFGLVDRNGDEMMSACVEREDGCYTLLKIIQRSELRSKKNDFLHGGDLEIFCEIFPMESGTAKPDGGVGIQEEEEKSKAGDIKYSEVSVQTENEFGVKEEEQSKAEDSNSAEASTQTQNDFGENEYENTGVEVSTQTEAYICYFGNLLGDRPSVLMFFFAIFAVLISCLCLSMVEPVMKNNSTEVFNGDLDPDTSDFLHYLCTGGDEKVTSRNALDLLTAADKYPVKDLKNVCLKFMVDNICIDNFCDVLTLSLRHRDTELTDAVTRFFMKNAKGIMETANWQVFLTENPILGNELLIKYFQSIRKAKNPG